MGRIRNATDLGIDLDRIADGRAPRQWVYLDGVGPWDMVDHAAAFLGIGLCPVCGWRDLKDSHYCSGCDRAGLDGIADYDGEPIGSRMDPDYHAEPTAYRPGKLKGGKK